MSSSLLPDESAHVEARYQDLVGRYYYAQANFHTALQDCAHLQLECIRLEEVLKAKHDVITELLPHYPYPLTPLLQAKIDLH